MEKRHEDEMDGRTDGWTVFVIRCIPMVLGTV